MPRKPTYQKRKNNRPAHAAPSGPRQASGDAIAVEGLVVEALPNTMFTIELENKHRVLATLSGKMRIRYIKVLQGDRVTLELSPYDLTRGRITYRHK